MADKVLLTIGTDVRKYSIRGAIIFALSAVVISYDGISIAVDEPVIHVLSVISNEILIISDGVRDASVDHGVAVDVTTEWNGRKDSWKLLIVPNIPSYTS